MPFDGSGNFTRVMNWVADAAAGIKIKSDRHDTEDNNFASGLSNVICKDGQTTITANIPFNGKKITGLANPTGPQEAATKNYVDALKTFSTGIILSGSTTNGQITFTGTTGPTGLSWTAADLYFGTRLAGAPAGSVHRFVWNNNAAGTGTDVAVLDETGNLTIVGTATAAGFYSPYLRVGTVPDGSSNGNGIHLLKRTSGFSEGIYFTDGAGGFRGVIGMNETSNIYFRAGDVDTTDITFSPTGTITANAFVSPVGGINLVTNFISSTNAWNAYINGGTALAFNVTDTGFFLPNGTSFSIGGGIGAGSNGGLWNTAGYISTARASGVAGANFVQFINPNGQIGQIAAASPTSIAYQTTSDGSLKDVKGEYSPAEAIAIIRADPVKAFTWKATGEDAVGWIAQHSFAVDKDLAVPPETDARGEQVDPDARWGIDYGRRTPYLWAALTHALDEIDALKARITALETAP